MPFFIDEKGLPTCCGERLLRPHEPYCGLCYAQYDRWTVIEAIMSSGKFDRLLDRPARTEKEDNPR